MEILKQAEGGVSVPKLCREHGMSNASFYKWRAKYGGMYASLISRQNDVLKEALGKKWEAVSTQRDGLMRCATPKFEHCQYLPSFPDQ